MSDAPSNFDFSDEELDAAEERLNKLAKNRNFISGIYNYCDRWCERCPMTSRCMNYAQENAERKEAGDRDASNERFWRAIAKNLKVTERMILKEMEKRGIEPSEIDTPEVREEVGRRKSRRERVKAIEPVILAQDYGDRVTKWFESHRELMEEKARRIESALQADIAGTNPMADFNDIEDAVEIVGWYQHQIEVKLIRALSALEDLDAEDDEDDRAFARHDSDGSAKVALIGIDRSIAAWARLREHFPDERDQILDTLVLLDRLRKEVETRVPNARKFKRPGFDDMPKKRKNSSRDQKRRT